MITLKINLWALLRWSCWMLGHIWEDYTVLHPMWNSEGRYCRVCKKQEFVRYGVEFSESGETIQVRTDWNGTERWRTVTLGRGTNTDPFRYERVSVDQGADGS